MLPYLIQVATHVLYAAWREARKALQNLLRLDESLFELVLLWQALYLKLDLCPVGSETARLWF